MFEQLIALFLIYLYSFFVGLGFYCFVTPKYLQKSFLLPFLAPMFGLMIISIVNIFYMYTNTKVTNSPYTTTTIGAVCFLLILLYKKEFFENIYEKFKSLNRQDFFKIILVLIISLFVLSPVLRSDKPTTPYRIGIDQVGYAESAQFLFNGGTYQKAADNIKSQLAETDINKALKRERLGLNFNSVIDAEFIVNWPRCGYHTVVATLTKLIGGNHVFETEFIILIIPYALIFALVFYLMKDKFEYSSDISFIVAMGIALNCNLLNLYYEGQYAQIFFIPIFSLLLISYMNLRSSVEDFSFKSLFMYNSNYSIIFPSLLIAAVGSCYLESLILLFGFVGITVIYDFIFKKRFKTASFMTIITSMLIGLLIILPQSIKMIQSLLRLTSQFSTAGFWQPKWASVLEILGIFNMYTPASVNAPYSLLPRSLPELIINISLSTLIIMAIFLLLKKNQKIDASFWLTAPTLILLVYLKTRTFEHIHNYQYMKTYTTFLPIVFVLVFVAIDFVSKLTEGSKKKIIASLKYLFIFTVMISGLNYIKQYNAEAGYVTKDMYSLSKFGKEIDSYAIVINKNGIKEHMLAPIIPFNWLNYSESQFVQPALSKTVLIIVDKNRLMCEECFTQKYSTDIVYSNPSYIFIDTKLPISAGYNNGKFDWRYFVKKYGFEFGGNW